MRDNLANVAMKLLHEFDWGKLTTFIFKFYFSIRILDTFTNILNNADPCSQIALLLTSVTGISLILL